jgi:hypothetical protein
VNCEINECQCQIIPLPEEVPVEHLCAYCGGNPVEHENSLCDDCVKDL